MIAKIKSHINAHNVIFAHVSILTLKKLVDWLFLGGFSSHELENVLMIIVFYVGIGFLIKAKFKLALIYFTIPIIVAPTLIYKYFTNSNPSESSQISFSEIQTLIMCLAVLYLVLFQKKY